MKFQHGQHSTAAESYIAGCVRISLSFRTARQQTSTALIPPCCAAAVRILEVLLTAQPRGGQNQEQQRKVEKRAARLILAVRSVLQHNADRQQADMQAGRQADTTQLIYLQCSC